MIDCGSTCSGEFGQGDTLTLNATPDAASTFSGWSGACAGRGSICSVRVDGDLSVTAEFSRILATLTVRRFGRGTIVSSPAGIRCGRACSHRFTPGPVTLTAKPARGWRFARWRGACRGTRAVCRLTLLRGQIVAASFTRTAREK